ALEHSRSGLRPTERIDHDLKHHAAFDAGGSEQLGIRRWRVRPPLSIGGSPKGGTGGASARASPTRRPRSITACAATAINPLGSHWRRAVAPAPDSISRESMEILRTEVSSTLAHPAYGATERTRRDDDERVRSCRPGGEAPTAG